MAVNAEIPTHFAASKGVVLGSSCVSSDVNLVRLVVRVPVADIIDR